MTDIPLTLLVALAALLVIAIAVAWWVMRRPPAVPTAQRARGPIDTLQGWEPQVTRVMTVAEQRMHTAICQALPGYLVLAQVPLARFLKVPTRNSYAEWLRRVGQQCVDFVICDRHTKAFAVVELTSPKSLSDERLVKRQARKTKVLKAAGISFHEWPENTLPSSADLRAALLPASGEAPEAAHIVPGMAPETGAGGAMGEPWEGEGENDVMADPPQSTWFDDLDSGSVPLGSPSASSSQRGPDGPVSRS